MKEASSNLTNITQTLTTAWQDVLGLSEVDPQADFLSLGGDSVQASRVVVRVREHLGINLPIHQIIHHTSLGNLARHVAQRATFDTRWPQPRRLPRGELLALAPPQRRLWYLDQLHQSDDGQGSTAADTQANGDHGYNMAVAVRFDGTFDGVALQRSLDEILRRHEVLRTRLVAVDGAPWQQIDEPVPVPIEEVDLTDVPADRRINKGYERAEATLRRPFDLANDLMLRAIALHLGDDDHLIILIMHHIASDGWSIGIVLSELAMFYRTFGHDADASPSLPSLELQYADMARWQEEVFARREQTLLEFWRGQLANAPQTLELPLDRPRPNQPTHLGASRDFAFDTRQRHGLKALNLDAGITLFNTLLAAFGVLLFRTSGQRDMLFSVPAANRLHPASEALVGFFTNMLVVRLQMHGEQSFSSLLTHTQQVCFDALQHQDLPFDRLVSDLQPDRQQGQTPFVQTGFALQNAFDPDLDFPGLTVEELPLSTGRSHFDLSLSMTERADGIPGSIDYRSELFDATTIRRLTTNFRTVVDSLLANPDAALSELSIMAPARRHQLLVEWNETEQAFDLESCVHQLVEMQVVRMPQAEGVRFEDDSLTYQQLDQRANHRAHELRELGVDTETAVGVLLERSLELPVTLLAVLKAGGTCVPLAPDLPSQRLALILDDTNAAVVATTANLQRRLLPDFTGAVLDVAEFEYGDPDITDLDGTANAQASQPPSTAVSPSHIAYVIYTSGSTGRPKGVRMHHRGLCQRLLWQQKGLPLANQDRVLQNLSIGFDAAFWQIFGPLIAGAAIVLPKPGGHMDTTYLAEFIADQQVTCADFVPSVLTQLLEEPAITSCVALRQIVSGGEALHGSVAQRVFHLLPKVNLINVYGPTETSLTISTKVCTPQPGEPVITIGRPIANTAIYLLDQHGRAVPLGAAGEVHAGGLGVTGGYLARPALTAERFVPNPFATVGTRLYKTGDLARLRTDGELDFLGRVDHQVKVRGVRMELGEIEAELARRHGVLEVAVLARDDVPGASAGEKRLVAYVVVDGPSVTAAALRRGLSQHLPPAMVPGIYLLLDSMPLSVNGKIDRAALPAPQAEGENRQAMPPRDSLELELAQIWSQSLNLDEISIRDNFFDLGGHSLLAVRLMAAVQHHFDVDLELGALYASGTVAEMAGLLRTKHRSNLPPNLVTLRAGEVPAGDVVDGQGLPLFCVHAVDGTATVYGALARTICGDRPVYGLQAPGLEDGGHTPDRFEDLAAVYAQAMIEVWPDGPYALCGWSAGGLLASELAGQLEATGHTVHSVVLIDTHPSCNREEDLDDLHAQERLLFAHAWLGGTETGLRESLAGTVTDAADTGYLDRLATLAIDRGVLLPDGGLELLGRRWQVFRQVFRGSYTHRPTPHGCPVTLLRAEETPSKAVESQERACRALTTSDFQIHSVPANHHLLLRAPAVEAVADLIDQLLT